MSVEHIRSPFHWFYGTLQNLIYYCYLLALYAVVVAIAASVCVGVIWFASKLYELYLWLRTPAIVDAPLTNQIPAFSPLYLRLEDSLPQLPKEEPKPPPKLPPPPKPRKTEEEIMRETLQALKRSY